MVTGPSSSSSPYLHPSVTGATITSLVTAGDTINAYVIPGSPDGLGAFDNNDGTFTVLLNHEFSSTTGSVRSHGSAGAFVTKFVIRKIDYTVDSATDLVHDVHIWNGTGYNVYNSSNPSTQAAFNRFCSADLPAVNAFFNPATGWGTNARIFMNSEECGTEGRAFAHVVTGASAGHSFELPFLGKGNFENAVACPYASDKTVVVMLDDAMPGQVYFYIGKKKNSGTDTEKAGLTEGKLFGVSVDGMLQETASADTTFRLIDLGQVQSITGTSLNTLSSNLGVSTFLRPEDGAWDPSRPGDFYFATTNSYNNPSRLWRLRFSDPDSLEAGGMITAVLDGTEGQQMLDNLTIDKSGIILLQEDPGANSHLARVWQYNIASDQLVQVARHDPSRFVTSGSRFLTEDEESSGVIDVQEIAGPGKFLLTTMAHYGMPAPVVEGGQLMLLYNPESALLAGIKKTSLQGKIQIFPNPANGYFTVVAPAKQFELVLTELSGKLVSPEKYMIRNSRDIQKSFDCSALSAGIYFMRIRMGDSECRDKLVITR